MQERPFSVSQILTYGENAHRNSTVTTYLDTTPEVTTFKEIGARVAALANALADEFGIQIGDRVATLMVNRTEHLGWSGCSPTAPAWRAWWWSAALPRTSPACATG